MNKTYTPLIYVAGIFLFLITTSFVLNSSQEEPAEYIVFSEDWINGKPTGFMGESNGKSLKVETIEENPYKGTKCVRFAVDRSESWRGLHVQYSGAWNVSLNETTKLPDLSAYDKLEFYARAEGKNGDVYVLPEIGVGGGGGFEDVRTETFIEIGPEWRKYSVNLKGMDLKRINTVFYMVLPEGKLYMDEIRFVKSAAKKKKK